MKRKTHVIIIFLIVMLASLTPMLATLYTKAQPTKAAEESALELPWHIKPTLIPKYWTYVKRISVVTQEFVATLPNGTEIIIPAAILEPKLISRTVSPEGNTHEYYALMRDSDPEAMMDLITGPSFPEDIVACDLSRLCLAAVDIYLDGDLICSFPETTPVPGPWIGYTNFDIPK